MVFAVIRISRNCQYQNKHKTHVRHAAF
ncbi:hypothetical protein MBGDN05_00266, partial [Thermoplasmatales archaeon SCGC AB-539-N05]